MKKQDQTVENMIMQAHYLEALEIESKAQKTLAEMERQDFINTITELKAMIGSLKLTISSLKLTIDTLRQTISSQNATIASFRSQWTDFRVHTTRLSRNGMLVNQQTYRG